MASDKYLKERPFELARTKSKRNTSPLCYFMSHSKHVALSDIRALVRNNMIRPGEEDSRVKTRTALMFVILRFELR